jgi:hypothetical protein
MPPADADFVAVTLDGVSYHIYPQRAEIVVMDPDGPIVFEWPIYSVRGRRMSRALSAEKFAWEDWTKIRNLGIYDNTVLYMDFEHHEGHLSLGYKTTGA